jgi:HemY protein
MWRVVLLLIAAFAAATGLAWLADRPGSLIVNWQGHVVETSVFHAIVALALMAGFSILLWSIGRQIWTAPANVGQFFTRRRQEKGLDALSSGMIAIGAGDQALATRYAVQARKSLPNEPLTHLLRAQAAQLSGDRATSRRIFEAMLGSPDTEQLGLRGLYLEASREDEGEVARQFAERAVKLNPKLAWAVDALFDIQCRESDWTGALETLAIARKHAHVEKAVADRRRAVLLTAEAQPLEDENQERALALALEAHGLAPDLVPAAAIAARVLASRGNTARATRVVQRTWTKSPHPDLATAYAYARPGDSPKDRLDRLRQLCRQTPNLAESGIALATAAIEAKAWDEARSALEPLLDGRLSQRVCTLMARIEGEQHGNHGRVREWLARAVNAPRDPSWTADGMVAPQWLPVSPVSGQLDAFQWRVPLESVEKTETEAITSRIEELVSLGAPRAPAIEQRPAPDDNAGDGDTRTLPAPASTPTATLRPRSEAAVVEPAEITPPSRPAPSREAIAAIDAEIAAAAARGRDAVAAAAPPAPAPPSAHTDAPAEAPRPAPVRIEPVRPVASVARNATEPAPSKPQVVSNNTARPKAEPRIFVPPRAPDDPGTEPSEGAEPRVPPYTYRPAAKTTA